MLSVRPTKSEVTIQGAITFQNPNNNIVMDAEIIYDEVPQKAFPMIAGAKVDPLYFFAPQEVTLNFGPFNNARAYFNEQDGSFTPLVSGTSGNGCAISEPSECVESQYFDKTNTQLNTQYSNSFLGSITPANVVTNSMIIGGKVPSNSLSIEDFNLNTEIVIYPNPSKNGIFNISHPESIEIDRIIVNSISGKFIKEIHVSKLKPIDLSYLSAGLYIVKIYSKNDKNIYLKKIIIE